MTHFCWRLFHILCFHFITVFMCFLSREGHSGGPEAVELGELKLQEETKEHTSPSLQTVGALLREACVQLPSIRGCFLTHLAHLEPSVLMSRDALLGRNPWINSHLLPELTGPTLPSDWPFLPLVSLYERSGVSDGGGLAVEELPGVALQAVTHCLQWLLLLEVWREEALKVQKQVKSILLLLHKIAPKGCIIQMEARITTITYSYKYIHILISLFQKIKYTLRGSTEFL